MNPAPRRFPSITNEDAIRPHENAFRRWSSPDFGTATADGFAAAPTMLAMSAPPAPATDRADTMAAHNPPSFTVYTPEQVKATPYRKSMPAYDEVNETDSVGARTLLKWTGIGIVAGLAVLTALIVVLNFGGDRGFASVNARSALVGNKTTVAEPAQAPAKVEAPVAAKPTPATPAATPKTDLELDAPATAPAKKPATAKVAATKKKR